MVAAVSALALVVAALWLQHCCKSPQDPDRQPGCGRRKLSALDRRAINPVRIAGVARHAELTSRRYSQAMTVLSRGARVRRGGRRPGWVLLTALLVLAIAASSALVFTNRVELLKLAVILALWAAVVGAFVSVIYRRQSDADQARVRDLKLVYDLQLDREISARREYELTVESQLRRELASELRAQAADEVAALRAELAALRTSLEILFDTDLEHRPALETHRDRGTARAGIQRLGPQWRGRPGLGVQRSGHVRPAGQPRRSRDRRIRDHRRARGAAAAAPRSRRSHASLCRGQYDVPPAAAVRGFRKSLRT